VEQLRGLLYTRQKEGTRSLRRLNRHVDRPLARLIHRCLAYNPKDRPQTATAVARTLQRRLSHIQREHNLSGIGKTSGWFIRHPRVTLSTAVLFAAAVLTGAWIVTERDSHSYDNLVRQAQEAYEAERFNEVPFVAEQALAKMLQVNGQAVAGSPHLDKLLYIHNQACQKLGNGAFAFPDGWRAEDLLQHGRDLARIGFFLNNTTGSSHESIILFYRRALAAGYKRAEVYNNLGYSYYCSTKLPEARQYLDEAVRQAPQLQAAWHNRALVDLKLSISRSYNPSQGIDDIKQALALEPKCGELYYDAARLYAVSARHDPGGVEPALVYSQEAVERGYWQMDKGAFRSLRQNPRFKKLFARANLPLLVSSANTVAMGAPPLGTTPLSVAAALVTERSKDLIDPSQRARRVVDPCPTNHPEVAQRGN
jgi:tetratricopeptide (TPR) repeat protein